MIVTIFILGVIAIYLLIFLAPMLDYLCGEYRMAKRISKKIAKEDLKKSMPDFPLLFNHISCFTASVITILSIFGAGFNVTGNVLPIFIISTLSYFISVRKTLRWHIKETLEILVATAIIIFIYLVI